MLGTMYCPSAPVISGMPSTAASPYTACAGLKSEEMKRCTMLRATEQACVGVGVGAETSEATVTDCRLQ